MFDTLKRPTSSLAERLALALAFVLTLTCLVSGVFALRGTARLLAVHEPAARPSEVLLLTSASPADAGDRPCVDSAQRVHYAPTSSQPAACPDRSELR